MDLNPLSLKRSDMALRRLGPLASLGETTRVAPSRRWHPRESGNIFG